MKKNKDLKAKSKNAQKNYDRNANTTSSNDSMNRKSYDCK